MIRMDPLGINEHLFMTVTIQLPGLTTRLIYCTKGILFDECWRIDVLSNRCRVPVCIGTGKTFEELLRNQIKQCSFIAEEKGIQVEMEGKEALLKMIDES